ncbi:hypothetical protein SISSUDRAFT_1125563 [Sistotremastrum suecicum HHB10207 ss-3]|uniref:BRCA2 OB1 domain-containing protein n=1 Tax=Sistotremastrum suecicum HHB10207 ss-3 TaxID=1314776 RepID=A0A166HH87_9AGAM|nr:hypothetical protein SISSUDRAFT_1125563 [Sistotremastrum suecicum HHB10207 ss-3]
MHSSMNAPTSSPLRKKPRLHYSFAEPSAGRVQDGSSNRSSRANLSEEAKVRRAQMIQAALSGSPTVVPPESSQDARTRRKMAIERALRQDLPDSSAVIARHSPALQLRTSTSAQFERPSISASLRDASKGIVTSLFTSATSLKASLTEKTSTSIAGADLYAADDDDDEHQPFTSSPREALSQSVDVSFQSAKGKSWTRPSAAALQEAERKVSGWFEESVKETTPSQAEETIDLSQHLKKRLPLSAVENLDRLQGESPKAAESSAPYLDNTERRLSVEVDSSRVPHLPPTFTRSGIENHATQPDTRAIESEIVGRPKTDDKLSQRLGEMRTPVRARIQPMSATPNSGGVAFRTPRSNVSNHKFVSPLKKVAVAGGVQYPQPSRLSTSSVPPVVQQSKPRPKSHVSHVRTLQTCGLRPGQYSVAELDTFGINTNDLLGISPTNALSYQFTSTGLTGLVDLYDSGVALQKLHSTGYTRATKGWVDNGWGLILWKLAALALLEPYKEVTRSRRWCREEVQRQFEYRHRKELDGAFRPPLRLIAAQDATSAMPLILCISDMIWAEERVADDGTLVERHPEFEISDGWYRLRASVDEPMARAARRGFLRIGMKIGCSGARFDNERKEPMEILDAYSSCRLILSGNSTHLVPWHSKLGFQRGPFISSLRSLTPDGGLVAVAVLTVVKAYPIGYIDVNQADTSQARPRAQAEEDQEDQKWRERRDAQGFKLHQRKERILDTLVMWADQVERSAGGKLVDCDGTLEPPELESLVEEAETSKALPSWVQNIEGKKAAIIAFWLRRHCATTRDNISRELEDELQEVCPPRQVRNFRAIRFKDARAGKKPANRDVVVTVWDFLRLATSDDGDVNSGFQPGDSYMVMNLIPIQQSSWMGHEQQGSEIYLSTRNNTRWLSIDHKR